MDMLSAALSVQMRFPHLLDRVGQLSGAALCPKETWTGSEYLLRANLQVSVELVPAYFQVAVLFWEQEQQVN